MCVRMCVCVCETQTCAHTRTPNTQPHYLLLCCQKLSGRSKWLNVFDGILHFLNLPHRSVWLERVSTEKNFIWWSASRKTSGYCGGKIADSCVRPLSLWARAAPHVLLICTSTFTIKQCTESSWNVTKICFTIKPILLKHQAATLLFRCYEWYESGLMLTTSTITLFNPRPCSFYSSLPQTQLHLLHRSLSRISLYNLLRKLFWSSLRVIK